MFSVIIINVIIIEATLQIVDYPPTKHHKLFCEHNELLGWQLIPNHEGWHRTKEYAILEKTNSKGLREEELAYEKADDVKRILFLGDSFAEGYAVELEERFSEKLGTMLNNRQNGGKPIFETINAGVGGYSTDQEYLFYIQEGYKYDPDLVVLMFYMNDIWYNKQNKNGRGSKPLFVLNDERLELTGVPVPKKSKATFSESTRMFIGKSKLATLGHSFVSSFKKKYSSTDVFQDPESNPEVKKAWEMTEAIIKQLDNEVSGSGKEFAVFYIPHRMQVYSEDYKSIAKEMANDGLDAGANEQKASLDKIEQRLFDICERNNISCIGTSHTYQASAEELLGKGLLYFPDDGHWTKEGHAAAADIIFEYISQDGIV